MKKPEKLYLHIFALLLLPVPFIDVTESVCLCVFVYLALVSNIILHRVHVRRLPCRSLIDPL